MRAAALFIVSAVLIACTPPAPPTPPSPPSATLEAPLSGAFSATSTTAMGITGDLRVEEARLAFAKGFMLETEPAGPIDITTPVHKDGDSFAQTMTAPTSLAIIPRKVTNVIRAADARIQPLCGDAVPTWVALAHDTPATTVSMAVFSGPDAPGPDAVNSALCGTFLYDK